MMKTSSIWRSQSFYTLEEACDWLSRDFYGNDVEGVVSDLESVIEWAESMLDLHKQYVEENN